MIPAEELAAIREHLDTQLTSGTFFSQFQQTLWRPSLWKFDFDTERYEFLGEVQGPIQEKKRDQ